MVMEALMIMSMVGLPITGTPVDLPEKLVVEQYRSFERNVLRGVAAELEALNKIRRSA